MTDYTKGTGSAGTIMIRDLGYQVQFWLHCSDPATNSGALPWQAWVNGGYVEGTVPYPAGTGWKHVASYDVASSQDVTFGVRSTGTMGFGGPTTLTQYLNRSTIPAAPTNLRLLPEYSSPTNLAIAYDRPSDGGSALLQDEAVWYYPGGEIVWDDTGPMGVTSPQDGAFGPKLKPYTEYHVYIRSRNANGWGPSAAIAVKTLAGARIHDGTAWVMAVPYVHDGVEWKPAQPYIHNGTAWEPGQ